MKVTLIQPASLTVLPATQPDVARIVEVAASLAVHAEATKAEALLLEDAGARRRGLKLAAQRLAASRLLLNGRFLPAPKALVRLEALSRTPGLASSVDVSSIDAHVAQWRKLLVVLHEWRGHVDCLPPSKEVLSPKAASAKKEPVSTSTPPPSRSIYSL